MRTRWCAEGDVLDVLTFSSCAGQQRTNPHERWMADQLKRDFYLVSLVCREKEREIQREFLRHIKMV